MQICPRNGVDSIKYQPHQLAEARIRDTLVGNAALQVAVELAVVPESGLQLMV
jgi:hypothetical protein